MSPTLPRLLAAASVSALALALLSPSALAADTIVQVPVDGLIDGRSVSTVSGTTITPWTAGQGVDGDGGGDGFVTNAVEAMLATMGKTVGGKVGVALPDDGVFAANARHPQVVLHFSNTAPTTSPQTHQIYISKGPQSFMFNVPQATYSKMFLFITASEGAANLTVTLNYAAGQPTVKMLKLPDYGIGGASANDPVFFNLIEGMRKWSPTDGEGDSTTHTITGFEIDPAPDQSLVSIQVQKTNGSHCVFWGATGVATSAVTTGAGGSSGADAGTPQADGGAGGMTGAGGTTGASGATGAAGTTGSAGTTGESGSSGGGAGATGSAGTSGSAGATGTAGTTGAAGSSGALPGQGSAGTSGEKRSSGSSGCTLSGTSSNDATWLLLAAAIALARRRRR